MSEVTRILAAIGQGDPSAAEQLLPLVYDELRQLAAQKLAQEKPGQTLEATGLVHEPRRLPPQRGFPLGLRPRLAAPLPGRRRRPSVGQARSSKKFARSARGFRTVEQ